VWTKAFDFEWSAFDQNRWVRRGLDMAELSRKFPGGMFRWFPRFCQLRADKVYGCSGKRSCRRSLPPFLSTNELSDRR